MRFHRNPRPSGRSAAALYRAVIEFFKERLDGRVWVLRASTPIVIIAGIITFAATHSPSAPAALTPADIINSSLELDANHNGIPDCWSPWQTSGTKAKFQLFSGGLSGQYSERVTRRSGVGSAGLIVEQGAGWCGPRAIPGHGYRLSAWVRGAGRAKVVAFYRTRHGAWKSWYRQPAQVLPSDWSHWTLSAPRLPSNAIEISFGVALVSTGHLDTDDYSADAVGSVLPPRSLVPPKQGYFPMLVPAGHPYELPSDATCARRVHYSAWEPRPSNNAANHKVYPADEIHKSLALRPRTGKYSYAPEWDNWVLKRVDGQFKGTTDEILQWAACKWGLPDNFLRAEADIESSWYQNAAYPSGQCVPLFGCGDFFTDEPLSARLTYCDGLRELSGYDFEKDYGGPGYCPKTFSIVGVMTWWNPAWGFHWPGNQNGMFPFVRDSTAAAVDYVASQIRGCLEGWELQLGTAYKAGDLWGCAGAWYAGDWHSDAAEYYIRNMQAYMKAQPWRQSSWPNIRPRCDADLGCPDLRRHPRHEK